MKLRKILSLVLALMALTATAFAFDAAKEIAVVSREEGSGTRSAFIELTGVMAKVDGQEVDNTYAEADFVSGTSLVMTTVESNEYAIGYASLSSVLQNDAVAAIPVNGVLPSADTILDGTYPIARPFNIVTKGELEDELAIDFLAFMLHAIVNTFIMTGMALMLSVPLGVFGGIYLAEYAKPGSRLVKLIRVTAETLAGIPSIVYALFGALAFVVTLGIGLSLVSGALTLAIMTLPLILRQTEESLLSVPLSYREGSYALGAGKLRTTLRIVLPVATPGILAAVLQSIGRITGETAALIFTAGTATRMAGLLKSGRTLSVHLYQLQQEGRYINEAFAAAVVLLLIVALMNGLSFVAARKLSKKGSL